MSKGAIKRVRPATIRKVVEYLDQELGLTVYGPCANLEGSHGRYFDGGLMNFSADKVLQYRRHLMNNTMLEREEQ